MSLPRMERTERPRVAAGCYASTVTTRPSDTSEAAWSAIELGLHQMTPRERVGRAVSLTILAHSFALAQIRRQHPEEDERLHRLRLAARFLDAATMKRAFGWPDDGSG